eukprot:749244-Amorphochlora_amoeboformis.AAC.1
MEILEIVWNPVAPGSISTRLYSSKEPEVEQKEEPKPGPPPIPASAPPPKKPSKKSLDIEVDPLEEKNKPEVAETPGSPAPPLLSDILGGNDLDFKSPMGDKAKSKPVHKPDGSGEY